MSNKNESCPKCLAGGGQAACEHYYDLEQETCLFDDVHLTFNIKRCTSCHQRYLAIFTELVDWSGGNDSQRTTVAPLSDAECHRFIEVRRSMDCADDDHRLQSLLKSLVDNLPNRATACWGTGGVQFSRANGPVIIGPHD